MTDLVSLAVVTVFLAALVLWARRARTLFVLVFIDGRIARTRGRIPQRLLDDFLVVLPRDHKGRIVIRCIVERGQARLALRGAISPEILQRLRNLLGMWPVPKLRNAPRFRSS